MRGKRRSFCVFLFQDGFTSSSSCSLSSLLKLELLRRKSLALFLRSWTLQSSENQPVSAGSKKISSSIGMMLAP